MEKIIFGIIGGLGLFIFGMKYLSDSLQKIASVRVRRWLRTLTNNPIKGLSLGALVTSIIQSSSVTTVILIGLINAGIINLFQAASVIIGANIGTTITAQIIAFKISKYALPAIGIGAIMILTMKKKKLRFWGQLILAFGLIFLGLNTMSSVAQPLKKIPAITYFFVALSQHPLLGICVGMIFTIIIQSSSASIGMLVALASAGLIDFVQHYMYYWRQYRNNCNSMVCKHRRSISARRMAAFHSIFNIVGAIYFTILISLASMNVL
jgi:phosphate:Na+ symporter